MMRGDRRPQGPVRLGRRLAAAAGAGGRVIAGDLVSCDGRLVTSVAETADCRLRVVIRARDGVDGLVRVAWTPLLAEGVDHPRALVTPLAPVRDGLAAEYDVDDLTNALAVDVVPATLVSASLVVLAEVAAAFDATQYGSARRAWQLALAAGSLPPAAVDLVRRRLQQ